MRILSVASELFPLVKTGGLADVAGALPLALAGLGCEVRSLVPGYPGLADRLAGVVEAGTVPDLSAARPACSAARHPAAPTCWSSRRRTCSTAPATPTPARTGSPGRTTTAASARSAA